MIFSSFASQKNWHLFGTLFFRLCSRVLPIVWWIVPVNSTNFHQFCAGFARIGLKQGLICVCYSRTYLDLLWCLCLTSTTRIAVCSQSLGNSAEISSFFHVWCSNQTFAVHFGTFWNKRGKLGSKQRPKLR